jgi:hypothetical protein
MQRLEESSKLVLRTASSRPNTVNEDFVSVECGGGHKCQQRQF